jgi:predicted DNA-binding transcriptional regulator YafY
MKLYNTAKSLILEIAAKDSVIKSIKNRDVVVIYYDGDEPGGRGLRTIEPVCLGRSKADNEVLRAWDLEGASHTGYKGEQPIPGWRIFRLDKITSFKPTGEKFNTPRPGYNPNGDKTFSSVVINAKFDDSPQTPDVNIDEIISNKLKEINDTYTRRYGDDYDLEKAADVYKQVYSAIEDATGNKLTTPERDEIRPKIVNKIKELQ